MYLKFSVKKAKQLLIMKIWIWWEKEKPQKLKENFSPRRIFHKFGAQDSNFYTVLVLLDYSVLVGRHAIFQYFLVKSDLCSLRPFRLHSSEKYVEY